MHCLDSDAIIDILNGEERAASLRNLDVCTTVITMQEVLVGLRAGKRRRIAEGLFGDIRVYAYTKEAAERTVRIEEALRKRGTPIGKMDEIIAGICLANNLTLVTGNAKHFKKVGGLSVAAY